MRLRALYIALLLGVAVFLWQSAAWAGSESQTVVSALKQADQGNWSQAQATIRQVSNPAARATVNWLAYTKGKSGNSFNEVAGFVERHPDWPYLDRIRLEAEKNITDNVPDVTLIEWFKANAPITAKGTDRYMRALMARGKSSDAKRVLEEWWPKASLTRDQQRDFYTRYNNYLDRTAHIGRMNTLLYKKDYANALAMADVLGGGYPALAKARKALAQGEGDVNGYINAVPARLQNDEGLLYQRLKWRRQHDLDQGAIEILNQAPRASAMHDPGAWWRERHIIVRRLIERKQYKQAYRLAAAHRQQEGFPLAEAEWVSGWLALNFVSEPWKAFEHFEKLYKNVSSPISLARGAYWAGKASDVLKHHEVAVQWYNVGAQHPQVFYGQMSAAALNKPVSMEMGAVPTASNAERQAFKQKDIVQAATWLHQAGLKNEAAMFLLRLSKNARTPTDYLLAAELADSLKQRHNAIKIAQALEKEKSINLNKYLYPDVSSDLRDVRGVEWALVSALIRQESRFDQGAMSHAGARGLMQLMPATAKEVASRNGLRHQTDWLTSRPDHNIALGSRYMAQMLDRFNGNYAMAAAAYNAGPGRVDRWIKEFGDPRRGQIDLIDWIELIPIYETRNYVQRVLEGVYVYRDRLKGRQPQPRIDIHVAAK